MIAKLGVSVLASLVGFSAGSADIATLDQLYSAIETGSNKKVAFLSQANYDSVHTVLPSSTEAVICDATHATCKSTADMIDHIKSGDFVAGLISGLPTADQAPSLHTFSSTVISLRAMFMAPANSQETPHGSLATAQSSYELSLAVDAAIVRLQSAGKDEEVRQNNLPFEFAAVHTCRTDDPSIFTVPNSAAAEGLLKEVLDTKVLKIGALGPYDWGGNDGNYKVDPPVGFYPDWLTAFCEKFNALAGPDGVAYNSNGAISCTRTYQAGSGGVFRDLFDHVTHVTEPYYTVDAFYYGTGEACNSSSDCRPANLEGDREICSDNACSHPESPRILHFRQSCSTLGVDSTFMTKRSTSSGPAPAPDNSSQQTTLVQTLEELNTVLSGVSNKKVAFLTQANYDSVQTVLHNDVEVVICNENNAECTGTADMIAHIAGGNYLGGLISGLPESHLQPWLNTFSSTVISLRAMYMRPPYSEETPHGHNTATESSEDLSRAVNRAIVEVQARGLDEQAKRENMPFEFMAVHTCRATDTCKFPVPNSADATGILKTVLQEKVLKIGALGPRNWGGNDGNYKVDPPVGFYPDYLTFFCEEFNNLKGPDGILYNAGGAISCVRTNSASSPTVFKELFDGNTHVTEPYYVVDALYTGTGETCTADSDCRVANTDSGTETCTASDSGSKCMHASSPRVRHFRTSCSTLGVDSTFMTKSELAQFTYATGSGDVAVDLASFFSDGAFNAAAFKGKMAEIAADLTTPATPAFTPLPRSTCPTPSPATTAAPTNEVSMAMAAGQSALALLLTVLSSVFTF